MKKSFIFCCQTDHGSYTFNALWDDDLNVEYEFVDNIFDRYNNWPFKNKKSALDPNTSKLFIEYIKKASIDTIEENIKKNKTNSDLEGYCTDCPTYKVMYMNGNWFDTAYWYSGEFGTTIEQQKYLYLAMMLCDENAINYIYWRTEGENIEIPFKGKARDLYFFDDNNEIIYIPNNIKQNSLIKQHNCSSYYEDLKDKFVECFKNGFIIPENSIDDEYWDLILINEDDEIFYYTGCKNDNLCMDKIIESINVNRVDYIKEPDEIEIIKRRLEVFKKE